MRHKWGIPLLGMDRCAIDAIYTEHFNINIRNIVMLITSWGVGQDRLMEMV